MARSFTYIDDAIESVEKIIFKIPSNENHDQNIELKANNSWAPYKIFNIGNSNPTPLMDFINAIEDELDKKAIKEYLPMQPGDVQATESDAKSLEKWINFKPNTSIQDGISKFISWYKDYYK